MLNTWALKITSYLLWRKSSLVSEIHLCLKVMKFKKQFLIYWIDCMENSFLNFSTFIFVPSNYSHSFWYHSPLHQNDKLGPLKITWVCSFMLKQAKHVLNHKCQIETLCLVWPESRFKGIFAITFSTDNNIKMCRFWFNMLSLFQN